MPVQAPPAAAPTRAVKLSLWELFVIFFRAGLALGGGVAIMTALEDELVHRRKAVAREDFLAMYALGRLVPSGTMTAVAVAYGYRFAGALGTAVAVTALVLPSTALTLGLTVAYGALRGAPAEMLAAVVLPSALAFLVVSALRFGKEVFCLGPGLPIAAAVFVASFFFGVHPSLLLLLGAVVGLAAWRR